MSVDIKQTAIKQLQAARGFIVVCDDGKQLYFGGEGITLHEALGIIEEYKYQLLTNNAKAKGE